MRQTCTLIKINYPYYRGPENFSRILDCQDIFQIIVESDVVLQATLQYCNATLQYSLAIAQSIL